MLRLAPLLGPWGRPDESPPKMTEPKAPRMNHPVSAHESRMCECGHTHYWHGDRAVALCGAVDGLSAPREESWQYRGPQCQCGGFTLAQEVFPEPGTTTKERVVAEALRAS